MRVAGLAQSPPRDQCLLDLNFTDHTARDGDNSVFGESLKRAKGNGRRLTRRGNQHTRASGKLRQWGDSETIHACLESANRVKFYDADLSSQCSAKASTPLADVSITNHSDRHSRDGGPNPCGVNDVKNRCPTGLARAVGVIEEGLGTCVIAGNHGNA